MDQTNPFKVALDNFENHLRSAGRATATILAYTKDIEQLLDFVAESGKTHSAQITTEDINNFKAKLTKNDYTAKSISRKINSIKSFFRLLQSEGEIEQNPANDVVHPKYELKPPRILSKLEYRALRDACKDDVRISAIVELLLQTGIRIGELANLHLEDVNMKDNSLNIRAYESHGQRSVPLNQPAKEVLNKYIEQRPKTETTNVFITKTGNQFLVRNIRSSIDRYFRIAGIESAKVNDLRHTFIAHQLTSGTPLVYISQLVGHKRLSTTEKYLEFVKEKASKNKPKLEQL